MSKIQFLAGRFDIPDDVRPDLDRLIAQAGASPANSPELLTFASAIAAPIMRVSDYEEVFADTLVDVPIGMNEEPTWPSPSYDVKAYETSADGQVMSSRIGMLFNHGTTSRFQVGFHIHDYDMQRATWNIVEDHVKDAGYEMARKRDDKVIAVLNTAASSLASTHVFGVAGGVLTKAVVDAVFKEAAKIGYRIVSVKVNSADILSMRTWTGGTFLETPPIAAELIHNGYVGEYGGARWQHSPSIPGFVDDAQDGAVYFLAEPRKLGYRFIKEGVRPRTAYDPVNEMHQFMWSQRLGYAVANPYAVFKIVLFQ